MSTVFLIRVQGGLHNRRQAWNLQHVVCVVLRVAAAQLELDCSERYGSAGWFSGRQAAAFPEKTQSGY